ncbi:Vanillate O-demethylase oxidoreductase [Leisingera sp. ANG-M1]|uniref:PDR/VanB family oxidoreductase n=1 Tax=Leisingera sp. ANG-M1 TaxID=1577895 RepID=UPI00057DE6DE|nr:PDR/VanB family oxidoreductase [Leisingera sp. ANG-M1]KIC07683.1 Vanillate O-demethylase oxidoreductase [Leisingera sp. ANG-M1]
MTVPLINVKIARKAVLAKDIAGLELVPADGGTLPPFNAGSHIDVHLGGGLIRQYSICNAPSDRTCYRLGVLREADGRGGSEAVHALEAGQHIQISEPRNHFALSSEARHSMLIAGGIGITPILSMAQALHAQGASFELHYCARTEERMAFRDELLASDYAGRVHLHFDDGDDAQKFDIEGLSQAPDAGTHLYVCGPTGFMDAVLASAAKGWPSEAVHREYFAVEPQETDEEDRPFRIKIASTGQIVDIPADMAAIDVLEELGFDIPKSCEQGICGTCITKVLEGTPDHRDFVLTDEEHAENDQMTVCCSRAHSDLLVLDL